MAPQLVLTDAARDQLSLLFTHDFTLEGKGLRLQISGKECDGFTYSCGPDDARSEDIQIPLNLHGVEVMALIDTFSAFYMQEVHLDYQVDVQRNTDGFLLSVPQQKMFQGKFWKRAPHLVPPTVSE